MLKPSQTDEWVATTLRDVRLPAAPPDLTANMLRPRNKHRLRTWIAASSGALTMVLLVIVATLPPSVSLAQVAQAQAGQNAYMVVNTRTLGDGKTFTVAECHDGARWSVHVRSPGSSTEWVTVMDGHQTIAIGQTPGGQVYVERDTARPSSRRFSFDVQALLAQNGKPKVTRSISWHGRTVDRFEVHADYRDRGKKQTLDQIVIADAKSHLPLRVEVYRDHRSWGDTWDYEYRRPDERMFKVKIPASAQLFDLPQARARLQKSLVRGALIVDSMNVTRILFPVGPERSGLTLPVTIKDQSEPFVAYLSARPAVGMPKPTIYRINNKLWQVATVESLPIKASRTDLTIADRKLTNVPVFRALDASALLRPYLRP